MKYVIRKPSINKTTKQYSITLPKKLMKSLDPTLKFNDNILFKVMPYRRKDGYQTN